MGSHGKKVGKFKISTVLAEYNLNVRQDSHPSSKTPSRA
jgi:hypothetical protein